METTSGQALARVLRSATRCSSPVREGGQHNTTSSLLDELNENGDNALHFLLSSHQTCVETLESFFRNHKTGCRRKLLAQTNKDGANSLHIAVFRNSYHASSIVAWILDHGGSELASQPMKTQPALPLHIFASYAVTLDHSVWNRILQAYPDAARLVDALGRTPLRMLYNNVLRFRWATSLLNDGDEANESDSTFPARSRRDGCVDALSTPRFHTKRMSVSSFYDSNADDFSFMTIITPRQFIKYSLQLMAAIHQVQQPSLATVVATPQCPVLLLRLLDMKEKSSNDWGLLHSCCPNNDELIAYLLQQQPETVTKLNAAGQWPLHTCPAPLVAQSAPSALWVRDPESGLYPFQLAAEGEQSSSSLESIFTMLRMEPGVLQVGWRSPKSRDRGSVYP